MDEYVSKQEFAEFVQDVGAMLLSFDISIEVLASVYCKANKKEFEELCMLTAKEREKLHNESIAKHTNKIENYPKKEE